MKAFNGTAALAACLLMTASAEAMSWADIAYPILTTRAELTVEVRVTRAGRPEKVELRLPDHKKAETGRFRTYQAEVVRVLRAKGEQAGGVEKGGKIKVMARFAAPARPGQPVPLGGRFAPSLKVGQKYLLILRTMDKREEYYLPSYPKNLARAGDAAAVKRIEAACAVEKWAWGKPAKGLQLALVPDDDSVFLARTRRNGKESMTAGIRRVFALRNAGKKPIKVSVWPGHRYLKLTVAGPGGKSVSADLYERLGVAKIKPFDKEVVRTIAPGRILFVQPMGEDKHGGMNRLELAPGKWRFTARYSVEAGAGGERAEDLWTGSVESKPVTVEVKQPGQG
jgi:hypothetical protein